jgi:hypothetical protein
VSVPGLAEEEHGAEEGQEKAVNVDPRLLPSTLAPARILGLCCPRTAMASSAKLREEREWGEGANGQQGMAPERGAGFYCAGVVVVYGVPRGRGLGDAGGVSGTA